MQPHPHWTIKPLRLPLKYTWKISRNASDEKTNFIVSYTAEGRTGSGEAAPNIRYAETPEKLESQFGQLCEALPCPITDPHQLYETFRALDICYALRFAVESAWLHHFHHNKRPALQQGLGVAYRNDIPTSYTVPIMDPGKVASFYQEHGLSRFDAIKLKIDRDSALDLLEQLIACDPNNILLDANEAFKDVDDCIRFLESIRRWPIELVEQPLPSDMTEEAVYLKKHSPFVLFADESVTHDPDMSFISAAFHGINMKLMKAGGYFAGTGILKEAKKRGMRTMVGCMVETTLGISSAMNVCGIADYTDLDSFLLLKQEPFSMTREHSGKLSFSSPEDIRVS